MVPVARFRRPLVRGRQAWGDAAVAALLERPPLLGEMRPMRRLGLGIGVALLFVDGAGHAQPRRVAQMFTPEMDHQEISCATALGTNGRFDQDLRWWALGFWSGRNSESMSLVGSQTDANGVIAEIE